MASTLPVIASEVSYSPLHRLTHSLTPTPHLHRCWTTSQQYDLLPSGTSPSGRVRSGSREARLSGGGTEEQHARRPSGSQGMCVCPRVPSRSLQRCSLLPESGLSVQGPPIDHEADVRPDIVTNATCHHRHCSMHITPNSGQPENSRATRRSLLRLTTISESPSLD